LKPEDQYTLYHPAEVELGETIKAVLDTIDRVHPTRVVFDSLSELKLLARDALRYRRQILALKEYFAGRECTVLMLDDFSAGGSDLQLQSLAHGVILLETLPFEYGRARRRLRIVKFRGVATVEGFHDFVIRRGGLDVFPQLVAAKEPNGARRLGGERSGRARPAARRRSHVGHDNVANRARRQRQVHAWRSICSVRGDGNQRCDFSLRRAGEHVRHAV
jgi:circadian clock protein KaiC